MYTLELVTPPASEPVDLATLKAHLRLNLNDEDTLLSGYLASARMLFEALSGRQLMPATYKLHLTSWSTEIYIPKPPLKQLVSVKYYDQDDTLQTFTAYDLYSQADPAKLYPREFPSLSAKVRPAITIDFQAGYATANDVPQLVKQGIMLLAASYYANRESLVEKPLPELPMGFRAICDQYKVGFVTDMGMS